jgi:cobalt/nickel transport system ATP-binding protein
MITPVHLDAVSLTYRYRPTDKPALDGCSFTVGPGSRVALLGANGSGKTSLLLHLNGSLRPATGEVRLNGVVQRYDRRSLARWRRAVGLVVHDPDDMLLAGTVQQEISFGPLNLGLDERAAREQVDCALDALSLTQLRSRPTHLLSDGQRHRVALAAVAVMEPSVLLLDEPTAGLDPAGVEEALEVLDRLRRAGASIVMATHDVDLAYEWADEIAVMVAGRVAASGTAELLHDHALLDVARLRRPAVVTLWDALTPALRPQRCPRTVDALAAAVRVVRPGTEAWALTDRELP